MQLFLIDTSRYKIVKNELILNMTPGNKSKTFQNWSKATLSTSIPEERKILKSKPQYVMFTIIVYCEKSDPPITPFTDCNKGIKVTFPVINPVNYENRENLCSINLS